MATQIEQAQQDYKTGKITADQYNTLAGQVNSVGGMPNSNVISADSLKQTQPIDLSGTIVTPPDNGSGIVAGANTSANQFQTDYQKYLDLQNQNKDTSLQDLISSVTSDLPSLTGRGAEQIKQEQAQGVPQYNKDLVDTNAKILEKTAAYNKLNADLEVGTRGAGNTDYRASLLLGQQGAVNRQAAAEIGLLQAKALGLQGQATNAQNAANRAVDLMFQDREAIVNTKLKQIELATPLFNANEAKKAAALTYALNKETQNIADAKSVALEAAKNGADVNTIKSITEATDFNSALKAAGTSLATADTAFQTVKNADGSDTVYLLDKKTGNVIKKISGGSGGGGTIPTKIIPTVQTADGKNVPVTGYTLMAGDDPYVIAKNNGTDMATLQKLNPNITDWTKLPVGATINLPDTENAWAKNISPKGMAILNGLPETERTNVVSLINGDALLTDIAKGLGGAKKAEQYNAWASQVDPTYSANINKQRFTYKTQFNNPNGKEQLQINSINTALGHLAEFKTASDALGNAVLVPYNKLVNYLKTNTGNPDVAKLNNVITALSGELASIYKSGTAPTDQETEQWRNTILASFSKEQASGVAGTTANLISNKMLSLNNSFKNIMGRYPDNPIVNSDVLQQLNDAGVDTSAITSRLNQQGYDVPNTKTLKSYYADPKYTSAIKKLIARFPQYSEDEILQVLNP